jgi:hypothetical protein
VPETPKKRCYIISYDVSEGGEDSVIGAIKQYGTWAHITHSTWAIVTEQRPKGIRDNLIRQMPDGSRLFVVRSGSFAAWRNVMSKSEWLKKYL